MPRIDPHQLLKCLSVLLSPNGGIKSKDEVQRLASLMTKFSKKLVSKCIYVSILSATETDLLIMFMSAGGWDLTYSWLSDGVAAKNWPLVTELVNLLLICPVDIDRLKTNACPKLIKTLSKDTTANEKVRLLACKLVEQWLRVVRGDSDCSSLSKTPEQSAPQSASQIQTVSTTTPDVVENEFPDEPDNNTASGQSSVSDSEVKSDDTAEGTSSQLPVYKITIRDGKKILTEINSGDRRPSTETPEEDCSTEAEDVNQEEDEQIEEADDDEEEDLIKPVKLSKKPPAKKASKQNISKKPAKVHSGPKKERESTDSASSTGKSPNRQKNLKQSSKKSKIDSPKVKIDPPKTTTDQPKTKSSTKIKPSTAISPKMKQSGNIKGVAASNKELQESSNLKLKEKLSLSLKNKTDKIEGKEKNKLDDNVTLTEKEKETLSKFITPPISKVGKIPKKTSLSKEEKQSEERNRTLKDEITENKMETKKSYEIKKPPEIKRPEKKYSMSVEPKRSGHNGDSRPKTVKMYNSKFRSTGLEEEIKPPPPRPTSKKVGPIQIPPVLPVPDKKVVKRSSPPPEDPIPEKRPKPESPTEDKKSTEKAGGIKLIPPKPRPMFLQESDVFMDAMLAANTMKEPRKRKRRPSTSKDSGPSDPKKDAPGGNNSPNHSPKGDEASPSSIKPTFKFYQDTLDTSTEEDKTERSEDDSLEFAEPNDEFTDDQKSISSEDDKTSVKVEGASSGPLKGVLVHLKTKRHKKSVSWKEDKLESIKYFELDETERVNVTKNFADMKSMEREHERENFQIARKLAVVDVMEERTRWKVLTPIDIAAPVVAPGKNSQEKEIQYAREKTVPAAIYFNKRTIPDTAAEPDLEIHATTDPVSIPLEDITGSTESINDFTNTPWPEPRGQPPAPAAPPPPPPPVSQPSTFQATPGPFAQPGFQPTMTPFMPGPAPGMPMPPAGDCWRTGDGKVVPMPPEMYPPQAMIPPGMTPMPQGPMMIPPGVNPEMTFPIPMQGPNPSPEEMGHFGGGFPPMGPSPPHQMFAPPPPPPPQGSPGNNFQGTSSGNWQNSGGGNWFQGHDNEQPPALQHNQQGNSGRFQGSTWRGGRGGRNPDGWSGGSNSRMPICNHFLKRGFCRNNNCRFRHPR